MAERGMEEGQWIDREEWSLEKEDVSDIQQPIYTYTYKQNASVLLSYFTCTTGAIVKPPLLIFKSLFLTSPS
jgi:hypothetical protein